MRTTVQMVNEYPRAYGYRICKKCNQLLIANSTQFPNLEDKHGNELKDPTCVKCTPKKKKKDALD